MCEDLKRCVELVKKEEKEKMREAFTKTKLIYQLLKNMSVEEVHNRLGNVVSMEEIKRIEYINELLSGLDFKAEMYRRCELSDSCLMIQILKEQKVTIALMLEKLSVDEVAEFYVGMYSKETIIEINEEIKERQWRIRKANEIANSSVDMMTKDLDEDKTELKNYKIRMYKFIFDELERDKVTAKTYEAWFHEKYQNG